MRRLGIVALALALACSTGAGESKKESSGLYLIREGGLYGYIDKSGKVAIKPQFQMALDFSEGLAAVSDRGGMADPPPQLEIFANEAEDLVLALLTTLGGRWGYVDTAGKLVINPQFDTAGRFSEGLAPVLLGGRWGYVDRKGAMAINPQFDLAGPFAEGLAKVRVHGRTGYVDRTGQVAISPQFHDGGKFSEGLAPVEIQGNWGFIDREGKYAINPDHPQFESALPFRDHLAPVNVAGSGISTDGWGYEGWGYVDRSGKLVIVSQFDDARSFAEGLAAVKAVVKTGRHWGFIDGKGRLVIDPQFDEARSFSEGLAAVRVGEQWGFVDNSGKLVIDPQFHKVGQFEGDLCPVYLPYTDDRWAYIDHAGKLVWGEALRTAAAQGRTFADIHNVGKAVMFCLTDHAAVGAVGQQTVSIGDYHLVTAARVKEVLVRCSIPREVPTNDGWGHPYEYYLTTDSSQTKIMAIRSAGADGVFSASTYAKGAFDPSRAEEDIVWADGYFIRYPNY